MTGRPKRNATKRTSNDIHTSSIKALLNDPLKAVTTNDRKEWKGFCELESEPAYFNVMLQDFGVEGVKVQEVLSLDDEFLAFLPQPIYGLVFLFKWREEDPDKLEQSCPEGVWFANQTVSNACASVALLNIVNNIPGAQLGENLHQFKEFTRDLTPALRGDAISNFTFVKEIHNSFARKMDMLNADLHMKNEVNTKKQVRKSQSDNDDNDAGFHFIAYVPVEGNVWKLDGLERQPQRLGSVKHEDWIKKAKPDIEARMSEYEESQIEFAIMSLVRDPLSDLIPALASNIRGIRVLNTHLKDSGASAEKDLATVVKEECMPEGTLTGPSPAFGLTSDMLEKAHVSSSIQLVISGEGEVLVSLQELYTAQTRLRDSVRDEYEAKKLDQEKANARRHDYGPLALKLAQILARKPIPGYSKFASKKKKQKK